MESRSDTYSLGSSRSDALNKHKVTILLGLKFYGRDKTFAEILDAAGLEHSAVQRLEIAQSLEASGLIQSVSYQLPVTIRAELSQSGEKLVDSWQLKARKLTARELRNLGFH